MEQKVDNEPLSKLRNFRVKMETVKNDKGEITGYDYAIDLGSVAQSFPWMVSSDNLGRKHLNKDSLIAFLVACLLEQDRDVSIIYNEVRKTAQLKNWDPSN